MIKTLERRISYDKRGPITTGDRAPDGKARKLDHFNVSRYELDIVPVYGGEPKELVILLPDPDWRKCFDDKFALWGNNNTCRRFCDGERCTHRIDESVGGTSYKAGTESDCVCSGLDDGDKLRCRYESSLTAFIVRPETLQIITHKPVAIRNHAITSGGNLRTVLADLGLMFDGGLLGVPLVLSVRMAQRRDNARDRYPTWDIRLHDSAIQRNTERLLSEHSDDYDGIPARQIGAGSEPTQTAADVERELLDAKTKEHEACAILIVEIEAYGKALAPATGTVWDDATRLKLARWATQGAEEVKGFADLHPDELQAILKRLKQGAKEHNVSAATYHENGADSPGPPLGF